MHPDFVKMLAGSGRTVRAALTSWDRWPRKCSLVLMRRRFTNSREQGRWQMVPCTFIGWFLLGAQSSGNCMRGGESRRGDSEGCGTKMFCSKSEAVMQRIVSPFGFGHQEALRQTGGSTLSNCLFSYDLQI